jgi:hypothetical protein
MTCIALLQQGSHSCYNGLLVGSSPRRDERLHILQPVLKVPAQCSRSTNKCRVVQAIRALNAQGATSS